MYICREAVPRWTRRQPLCRCRSTVQMRTNGSGCKCARMDHGADAHEKWLKKNDSLVQQPIHRAVPTPPSVCAVMSTGWSNVTMTPAPHSAVQEEHFILMLAAVGAKPEPRRYANFGFLLLYKKNMQCAVPASALRPSLGRIATSTAANAPCEQVQEHMHRLLPRSSASL